MSVGEVTVGFVVQYWYDKKLDMDIATITDIGDTAVLGGMILSGAIYLSLSGCGKCTIFALLLSFLGTALLIALVKLAFMSCSKYWHHHFDVYSPSGHVALSFAVFGTYAIVIASQLQGMWRFIPALILAPVVVGIAVTRVTMGYHSRAEVLVGLIVGAIAFAVVFLFLKRDQSHPKFNVFGLVLLIILMPLFLHGVHAPAESFIEYVAKQIGSYIPICAKG